MNPVNSPLGVGCKILVIGGGGYLGTVMVRRLLEENYTVRILDSFIYGKKPVENFRKNPKVDIIEGDIRNIETVNSVMTGVSAVILLAAVVGDAASVNRPEQTIETNFLASQMIASACRLKNINRFIYASTCSVYGVGKAILDEDAPLNPVSLYAKTKISSERSILNNSGGEFAPVIMRMSTLYGYSPRMRFDLVVNTMTMTAFKDGGINVFGGEQWRPLLHLDDACDAFIKVLQAPIEEIRGKIYNVGSEKQNYRIKEVADIIKNTLDLNGSPIALNIQNSNIDARDYKVSFKKIESELNFEAKHSVEEAAGEIYSHFKSGDIKDPNQKLFYNHYFDSSEELVG